MAKTRFSDQTGVYITYHKGVGWRHYDCNDGFPKDGNLHRFVGPIYETKAELLADHENYLIRAGWMK